MLLPHLGARVTYVTPEVFLHAIKARTLALPVLGAAAAQGAARLVASVAGLISALDAIAVNGSAVLACDNGCGTARLALTGMKYTDKFVAFASEGEVALMVADLQAYFAHPPLAEQLRPLFDALQPHCLLHRSDPGFGPNGIFEPLPRRSRSGYCYSKSRAAVWVKAHRPVHRVP